MDKPFKVTRNVEFGKCAKAGQAGDFSFNKLANGQVFDIIKPWVFLKRAD